MDFSFVDHTLAASQKQRALDVLRDAAKVMLHYLSQLGESKLDAIRYAYHAYQEIYFKIPCNIPEFSTVL